MFMKIVNLILTVFGVQALSATPYTISELTTVELIKKHGYPVEVYSNILTEDGYLLELHRIPHGKSSLNTTKRSPVLLMHGLTRTSKDYVFMGPEKGLGYLLVERGYDVWLGNSRATKYSRKHRTLNPETDKEYWAFSWHEIGVYDLPAMFELMRNVTKKERFSYIGISQGTTVFYVFTSLRPEYNRNVSLMVSLGPVAYHHYINPILKVFEPIVTTILDTGDTQEFITRPLSFLGQRLLNTVCSREGFLQELCIGLIMMGIGNDPLQFNKTAIPSITEFTFGGSVHEVLHFFQNIRSGYFRQFDFGEEGNVKKYGTVYPPSYNLSKITAPVALVYSEGDALAQPGDVHRICLELSNCVSEYKVPFKNFNHVDFLVANDVVKLVFRNVFHLLAKYD